MDYGRLWADAPILPSHPAAHNAAAHHHPNPLHHHHHHHHHQQQQKQNLSLSYYPDRNPSPSPVAKLHYPFSAAAAAPSPADPYALNPYAPNVGYEGLHAPAAAAPSPAEPYVLNPYAQHGGYDGPHATAAAPYSYPGLGPGATSSRYYDSLGGGGGGGDSHGLTAKEAIRLYGLDPQSYGAQIRSSNGLEPAVPSYQYPTQWGDNTTRPISKQAMRKHPKRIIKVAQSAYCEVCKIDCNSPEVLNTHKQGKKHKKNLLKLQEAITARPAKASATTGKGMEKETPVADKDKDAGEQRRKRAVPATEEELEMKKKRVLEGGAEATEIKVCTICNVVVNSQQVLECHIAGQRHTAMVKKQQSEAGVN